MALLWTSAGELVELINAHASESEFGKCLSSCQNPNESVGAMGLTPLHHAVFKGRSDCVTYLLRHRVDVNMQDCCGYTPVHIAAKHGYVDILQQLISSECHADTNKLDFVGLTPLFHAVQEGQRACAELLLQNGANPNFCHKHIGYELHRIPYNTPECLATLLRYGADPETRTPRGLTALHSAVEAGSLEFVEILLEFGCDVNAWTLPRAPGRHRRNALQLAIIGNEVDIARCLLDNRADPNCRDQQRNTPLHHASAHRDVTMIQLLLDYGADIHARNDQNYQPLHRACSAGRDPDVLTLLLVNGAETDSLNSGNDTPLRCLLILYSNLSDLEEEDDDCCHLDEACRQRVLPFIYSGGRYTITTLTHDHRSVLSMLPILTSLPRTVKLLETSADRICIHDTEDLQLSLIPEPLRSRLVTASRNPTSLRQVVRCVITRCVGYKHYEDDIKALPLPTMLHKYLLFLWE